MNAEATTLPRRARLLNNWLLLLAMILANIGGQMYGPLLPLYLQDLSASVAQVGLFFTLSRIIPLALQILGGYIALAAPVSPLLSKDCINRIFYGNKN
jgi:MFS family permease